MGRKGLEPSHDEHVNVTPLIDVVMCLIIFFMLVGKLAKGEGNDDVIIPKTTYGATEIHEQRGRLIINVVPVTGGVKAVEGEDVKKREPLNPGVAPEIVIRGQKVLMNDLTQYLRKERKETPDIKVMLRADQEIAYDWIAPVLVACAQADIKSVHFSTKVD